MIERWIGSLAFCVVTGMASAGSGGGTIYGYSGNIGIGTSTPAQALEVNGSVLAAA